MKLLLALLLISKSVLADTATCPDKKYFVSVSCQCAGTPLQLNSHVGVYGFTSEESAIDDKGNSETVCHYSVMQWTSNYRLQLSGNVEGYENLSLNDVRHLQALINKLALGIDYIGRTEPYLEITYATNDLIAKSMDPKALSQYLFTGLEYVADNNIFSDSTPLPGAIEEVSVAPNTDPTMKAKIVSIDDPKGQFFTGQNCKLVIQKNVDDKKADGTK